jgi:hypothetical protein
VASNMAFSSCLPNLPSEAAPRPKMLRVGCGAVETEHCFPHPLSSHSVFSLHLWPLTSDLSQPSRFQSSRWAAASLKQNIIPLPLHENSHDWVTVALCSSSPGNGVLKGQCRCGRCGANPPMPPVCRAAYRVQRAVTSSAYRAPSTQSSPLPSAGNKDRGVGGVVSAGPNSAAVW